MATGTALISFTYQNREAALSITTPAPPNDEEAQKRDSAEPNEYSLPGFTDLKTVDDLVISMSTLGVSGPLILSQSLRAGEWKGAGAQFEVYSGGLLDSSNCEHETYVEPVAVKRALFNIQADGRLDLTSPKSRRQIHDMYLEVVALQHEKLRSHRNIVRLLGWSLEEALHETPLLVVELAFAPLDKIFEMTEDKLTYETMQQLFIDVGQGLDAIHDAGIIHGDIKPSNILVFENFSNTVPFVAKLADFGLSVGEVKDSMNDLVAVAGMSTDWCAPEIQRDAKLSTSQLVKADNFSYGLVLLSISCQKGQAPATKDSQTASKMIRTHADIPALLSSLLVTVMAHLLREDASQRPLEVGDLLKNDTEQCLAWSVAPECDATIG